MYVGLASVTHSPLLDAVVMVVVVVQQQVHLMRPSGPATDFRSGARAEEQATREAYLDHLVAAFSHVPREQVRFMDGYMIKDIVHVVALIYWMILPTQSFITLACNHTC